MTLLSFYVPLVFISLFMLIPVGNELRLRHPSLSDRKWKRILWLLSCLILLPMVMLIASVPLYLGNELKRFIRGDR